jgi:hypothetical protein
MEIFDRILRARTFCHELPRIFSNLEQDLSTQIKAEENRFSQIKLILYPTGKRGKKFGVLKVFYVSYERKGHYART